MSALDMHESARLTESSQYFDIDQIAEPGKDLPHVWPSTAEMFAEHMKRLRIRRTDQIICYDMLGIFSVARAAYMFRYFGAENVRILNGGLKKWVQEGREVFKGPYEDGAGLEEDGDYDYKIGNPHMVITDIDKVHNIAYYLVNGATDW